VVLLRLGCYILASLINNTPPNLRAEMYYTYAYLREDGTPYYIGKGKGYRAYQGNRKSTNPPKDKSKIIFLKQNLTEEEAFKHEIYMIAIFGRKDNNSGILRNLTNGGEGTSGANNSSKRNSFYGRKHTEETKLKISKSKVGTKFPNELKPLVSKRTKKMWENGGVFSTPEFRQKLSQSLCKKQYQLIDKEGEIYYTDNLMIFSKEHNLDYSAMYKVVKQKLTSYKGWVGKALE
jgi:hypothetical protein